MKSRLPQPTRQPTHQQQGSKSQPRHQSRPINQTAQGSATESVQKRGTSTYASIVSSAPALAQGPPHQPHGHFPNSPIRPSPSQPVHKGTHAFDPPEKSKSQSPSRIFMPASYSLILAKLKIVDSVSPNDVYQSTNQHNIRKLGEKVNQLFPSIPSDLINQTKYEVQPEPVKQPNGSSTFAAIMPPETSSIDVVCHPKEKHEKKLEDFFSVDLRQKLNDMECRFKDLEQRHDRKIQDLEQEVGKMRPELTALSVRQCLVLAQARLVEHYKCQNKLADNFESQKNREKAGIINQLVKYDEDLKPKFTKYQVDMMFGVEERNFSKTLLNHGNNVAHLAQKHFDYVSDGLEGAAKESLRVLYDYAYGQE